MKKQDLKQKADVLLKKIGTYKYALLVLLLGVALMVIPAREKDKPAETQQAEASGEEDLTAQLENILSLIDGAGRTKVLLTLDTGTAREYQTDTQSEQTGDTQRRESSTVLISAGSGTEDALVRKTTYPQYRGAVVVCDGADRAAVRLHIMEAVSSLTGLGSDKITVIKMSGN